MSTILENATFNLSLNAAQFAVIYEFLMYTKLGSRNVYEKAISDLMIALDMQDVNSMVSEIRDVYGDFVIQSQYNDDDGVAFEILESA